MHGVDPVRLTATMVPFETLLKDLRSPRPWPDQAGPAPQLPASAWQRLFTLAVSIPDDASYYLLPAWHFSTHGYFTFDDLHKAYGFQPSLHAAPRESVDGPTLNRSGVSSRHGYTVACESSEQTRRGPLHASPGAAPLAVTPRAFRSDRSSLLNPCQTNAQKR
jgi:hypothetical protein